MSNKQLALIKHNLQNHMIRANNVVQSLWFKAIVLAIIVFFLSKKELSLQISVNNARTSLATQQIIGNDAKPNALQETDAGWTALFMNPEKDLSAPKTASEKRKACEEYIQRFYKIAQTEMYKFKIPASITLAQGLLESNAGNSRLARQNNNHFGMKCFSTKCKNGHCSNFTDDTHKDFFRKYGTAWESFREHSQLLVRPKYKPLQQYGMDYKKWAQGLENAGYATNKQYAEGLIRLIKEFELYKYDK
jgi:flagellum-specific peptidoglycan hydrolase FlgJ